MLCWHLSHLQMVLKRVKAWVSHNQVCDNAVVFVLLLAALHLFQEVKLQM